MSKRPSYGGKYASYAAALLAAGSLVLSPLVMPAFAARKDRSSSLSFLSTFTPSGVDSGLAAKLGRQAVNTNGNPFPFTPAGAGNGKRTMTVAARANSSVGSNAISVRKAGNPLELAAGLGQLRPSDYRLTAAKGWQGFVAPAVTPKLSAPKPLSEIVGNSNYSIDTDTDGKPSRFSAGMKIDQKRDAAPPARGSQAPGDYSLDVGGSFSISRRIDVTAGVRYNSERDRAIPQVDSKTDNEAVYVGTKIRF